MRVLVALPEDIPVAADNIRFELFMLAADRARARAGAIVVAPGVRGREDPAQGQEERVECRAVAHTMSIVG